MAKSMVLEELGPNSEPDFVMKFHQVHLKPQQDKEGKKRGSKCSSTGEIKREVVTFLPENTFTVGHQCPPGIWSSFFYLSQYYEKWNLCWEKKFSVKLTV